MVGGEDSLRRPVSDRSLGDATFAVVAHGLLQSVTVIRGAAATLKEVWADLPVNERDRLLERLDSQAAHVGEVLTDLVQMLPSAALAVLEGLADEPT